MTNETENRIPLADLLVFHQLTRSLTSSFDLDTILRTILEQMERTIEAELWTLLMLDEATQELYYAIAAGGEHTCAVVGGAVWCWGSNTDGELGNGTTGVTPIPTRVRGRGRLGGRARRDAHCS